MRRSTERVRVARPPVPKYARPARRARVREGELAPYKWRGTGGRAGFVDEIVNRHPRAARAWFDVELGVIDAPWENKPCDDERPIEAKFREQLDAILRDEMRTDLSQSIAGLQGGWQKFLSNAASMLKYGAAPFERSWWDDESATSGDGMRLELFHVHPSSIQDYKESNGFGLEYIKQSVDGGTHRIPAERLVYIAPMGAAGEYEGWTPMRSLGFIVELSWQLAISTARRGRLDAGMFALEETEPGAAEQTIGEIEQALDELEAGQQLSGFIPHGMKLDFHSPAASGTNPVEIWKYVDGQVDHVIGAWVASLGLTSGSGSRALGDTLSIQDSKRWRRVLNLIGAGVSTMYQDLAADLGYPADVRVPTLCVRDEDAVDPAQLTAAIQAGVTAGILPVVPELTRELGERAGLSKETVDAMVDATSRQPDAFSPVDALSPTTIADEELVEPTSTPTDETSLEMADDSFSPPESARANAKRGLELRREHGRGGTEIGVARARDLASGGNVSLKTIGRMRSFFARHGVDEQSRRDDSTSAANIAWLLWGGDAGRRWVDSQKFDAMFSDVVSTQVGADDRPVEFFREFADVERVVEWATDNDRRVELDAQYQARMTEIRDRHVEDLRVALTDIGGLTDSQRRQLLDVIRLQYADEYTAAIRDHVFAVEQSTEAAGARERTRGRTVGGPLPDSRARGELRDFAAAQIAAMRQGIERQGETAARRVQADVLDQVEAQAPPETVSSRIGGRGLSVHGNQVANRGEGVGRIIDAALRSESDGLVPVEAFRTSVNDKNRCGTCKRRDSGQSGKTWDLRTAEDVQRFINDPEATTPDPDCDGMTNCRCGHLIRYARAERVDMSSPPTALEFSSLEEIGRALRSAELQNDAERVPLRQ